MFAIDCTVTVRFMILDTGYACRIKTKIQEEKIMENQNVYLKPVTLRNILKFAIPTIAMTVFMSFYTMVDGLFVSN